ncbi:uncharacterized protein CELE_T25D10.1 [Caenorhabditis elegans]|uniref:Uncharacterized protein T25D10.1 n=1 Tax=Caenorhabditis elegans TaxID=6239 RepID=YSW1_CAEEL|nr:Uncharacterized protein CELE_T25D10.1 [Caenorhabditis elegans]Q10017.2 RecName: Full=Uncharacterized protein T25D10.1 [Caenorhabditis elegans]CCD72073.1 Uncharacterized protein CELE_T25D10.1 [Caenorhabditis elegans]|eukprot:NP_495290.2 Uncharacterized protein CELE_T25D10.1 [Caenorhabditis elegans]
MFLRRRNLNSSRIICIISIIVLLLIIISLYPHKRTQFGRYSRRQKTIRFQHSTGEIGDQLFSLLSHLGVAKTLYRIPVINSANNSKLIDTLSNAMFTRFPSILQQFLIAIEPPTAVNRELGIENSSYEDPLTKFSEDTSSSLMVKGNGFKSFKYFDNLRSDIRLWVLEDAESVLEAQNLITKSQRNNFKICVHATLESNKNCSVKAIAQILNHYTNEYEDVMLIIASPFPEFTRFIFTNSRIRKYKTEKFSLISSSPEMQIIFSRIYCDVVFLTVPYSTHGWWMGYLAKDDNSHVFYFDPDMFPKNRTANQEDYFPPKWKKLSRKIQ